METNFKVDVPSFALGYSAGRKKGGSGGGESGKPVVEKDVNFYDYDGTLLHSYTVEEAQKLTALPKLPEQPGLICQEWNWTLDEIKAHDGNVDVGATYVTDDGSTRLYVEMPDGLTTFQLTLDGYGGTIDWGDGSSADKFGGGRGEKSHTYARPGEYVISMKSNNLILGRNSSSYNFIGDLSTSNYALFNTLKKVELGAGVERIDRNTFEKCYELKSITIPNGVKMFSTYVFKNCQKLGSIVIPRKVDKIHNYFLSDCNALRIASIGYGATAIGTYAFQNCYNLASITLPESIASVGETAFYYCYGLENASLSSGMPSVGSSSFASCSGLRKITIPNGVTDIGSSAFSSCNLLSDVSMTDEIVSIGSTAFGACNGLVKIVMPSDLATIGERVFYNCKGLKIVDFSYCKGVPALSNISAFTGLPTNYEIRVPASLYDSWKAATNWSSLASKIVAV